MRKTMKLASRGKRFAAGMIDAALPLVAYIIMTSTLGMRSMFMDPYSGFGNGFGNGFGYGYGYNYNYNLSGASSALMGFLGFMLLAYIIAEFVLYSKAKSIGKALIGLQVVSSIDGKPFSFGKMLLRECIVKGASSGVFMLGYIWILIDEKNRGWHDKILDSYVVDLKETERMHERVTASMAPPAPTPRQPEAVKPVETPAPRQPEIVRPVEAPAPKQAEQEPPKFDVPERVEAIPAPEEKIRIEAIPVEEVRTEEPAAEVKPVIAPEELKIEPQTIEPQITETEVESSSAGDGQTEE